MIGKLKKLIIVVVVQSKHRLLSDYKRTNVRASFRFQSIQSKKYILILIFF